MLIAEQTTYDGLSPFESLEQMNEITRAHRSSHKLSRTELEVLDVLVRHSCRTFGVSFLTKNNIGRMIGKSRRTIIRACHRLESLGIIAQHNVKRASDMRQTSNAVVIQPSVSYPDIKMTERPVESTNVTQEMSHQEALRPVNQKATKDIDTAIVPSDALRNSIPTDVFNALSTYFNADDIYKYYGTLLRAKRKVDRNILIEHCPQPFTDAIHAVVLKAKQGVIRNMERYFYKSFVAATAQASRILSDRSPLYYDWTA